MRESVYVLAVLSWLVGLVALVYGIFTWEPLAQYWLSLLGLSVLTIFLFWLAEEGRK